MKRHINIAITLLIISTLCGCKGYEKMLKSTDYDAKYEAAMRYYNEESYSRARQLFENLALYARGHAHAEDIAWYYGQSLLKSG